MLVCPTATPVRAARGLAVGAVGRPGEHALCLDALSRACQTTAATSHAYGARVSGSSLRRRNFLVWPLLATAAGYLPARSSGWRPVLARPLGWRGALWCDPHQPRSLVLIHLLSLSGLIVVASRARLPDCHAGPRSAGVGGGGTWSAWGARPLLGCPLPRVPNDPRDLPRLWCTRGWQQP